MPPLITAENLHKSFVTAAGELRVLKGIDITFEQGEMVGVVGASGAGKSTLLHILGTLDRPTGGTVTYHAGDLINPFDLGNGALAAFRNRMIGFVFQFHYLLPEFTAIENIMMPGLIARAAAGRAVMTIEELTAKAVSLLQSLGLKDRRDHKPGELSGGEQQRVAVARALLAEPRIVFADEPTGNLDTATGEELFSLIEEINKEKGITFVIVTHNESLARRCHRIVEMKDGILLNH